MPRPISRGRAALGYTLQLPTDEQFLLTRSELDDRIQGLLGGRAAEELVFGEVSTGAENDLEKAAAEVARATRKDAELTTEEKTKTLRAPSAPRWMRQSAATRRISRTRQ